MKKVCRVRKEAAWGRVAVVSLRATLTDLITLEGLKLGRCSGAEVILPLSATWRDDLRPVAMRARPAVRVTSNIQSRSLTLWPALPSNMALRYYSKVADGMFIPSARACNSLPLSTLSSL